VDKQGYGKGGLFEGKSITIRFLDPVLITNAGAVWKDGQTDWRAEALRRKIRRPKLIHHHDGGERSLVSHKIRDMCELPASPCCHFSCLGFDTTIETKITQESHRSTAYQKVAT
jgi:hypothetical protein